MKKEQVKIGMKVVPHQKTVFPSLSLEDSTVWKEAIKINQKYLYVVGWESGFNAFVLNTNEELDGDYFKPEDFEQYKQIDKNKIINDEIKKYYGERYTDEYHYNPVSGAEVQKLRELINTCIDKCR